MYCYHHNIYVKIDRKYIDKHEPCLLLKCIRCTEDFQVQIQSIWVETDRQSFYQHFPWILWRDTTQDSD